MLSNGSDQKKTEHVGYHDFLYDLLVAKQPELHEGFVHQLVLEPLKGDVLDGVQAEHCGPLAQLADGVVEVDSRQKVRIGGQLRNEGAGHLTLKHEVTVVRTLAFFVFLLFLVFH